MSRKLVAPPFHRLRRLQPEAFALSALTALVLAACSGTDSAPTSPAPASSPGGAAGNPSSSMPSTGTGGARACDPTDAVCVESCPLGREAVRCDTADTCPPGFVLTLTCGADASAPAVSACKGVLPREGAFCATSCPATQPSTCSAGVASCGDGWKLLSSCAG